jgi:hypothetical protein
VDDFFGEYKSENSGFLPRMENIGKKLNME